MCKCSLRHAAVLVACVIRSLGVFVFVILRVLGWGTSRVIVTEIMLGLLLVSQPITRDIHNGEHE